MNAIPLAYKYVALTLMLVQANFFASKVNLKLEKPITEQDVRPASHVAPPNTNDFTGSIMTDKYLFGFGWGHLANFHRNDFAPESAQVIRERNTRLSKLTSLVDTNGALQLATGWLSAVGVDVPALNKKYKLNIVQWKFLPVDLSQGPVMLPVYQVEWRGSPFAPERRRREMAVVTVTVLGTTKELVEYHVLDDSLFTEPRIQINDQSELLAIADADFQNFTLAQRSNLVERFMGKPNSSPVTPSN